MKWHFSGYTLLDAWRCDSELVLVCPLSVHCDWVIASAGIGRSGVTTQ